MSEKERKREREREREGGGRFRSWLSCVVSVSLPLFTCGKATWVYGSYNVCQRKDRIGSAFVSLENVVNRGVNLLSLSYGSILIVLSPQV